MNINLKLNLRDMTRWFTSTTALVAGIMLSLRILLRLFNADGTNTFVDWVYQTSGEILSPLRNVFHGATIDGAVFDFTALFGLVAYGVLAMWVMHLTNRFK